MEMDRRKYKCDKKKEEKEEEGGKDDRGRADPHSPSKVLMLELCTEDEALPNAWLGYFSESEVKEVMLSYNINK